jgi:hypothetical protein
MPIQDDRTRRLEQHFILVGVELANGEAASARETAQRIGDPRRKLRQIIEGEQVPIASGNEEIAFFARPCPDGSRVGIDQCPENFREDGLR